MERLFLECAARAALLVAGTGIVLYAMRVKDAAAKHRVWAGVMLLMLVLPIWTVWGPKAPVRVLPPMAERTANEEIAPAGAFPAAVPPPDTGNLEISEPPARPSGWGRQEILLGVYLLGFCSLLLRLAIGTVRAHRLVRRAVLRDGRPTSSSCAVPVTAGWLHPTVILPEDWHEWPQAKLDAVLTHEGEHARRRDPLVQWVALLNRALFWFHPAAWWLESRLAGLAEEACDNVVLARGHDPGDYSEYLMDMARSVMRSGARLNIASMAMPGSRLPQRIRKIIDGGPAARISRGRMACVIVACAITCTLFAAGTLDHARLAVPMVSPQRQAGSLQGPASIFPGFTSASIKINPSGGARNRSIMGGRPGQLKVSNFTLRELVRAAYQLTPAQTRLISGAPGWIDSRFDIEVRAQGNPDQEQTRLMLQSLLAGSLKLVVHHETQVLPVYALELSETGEIGPALRRHAAGAATSAPQGRLNTGMPAVFIGGMGRPVTMEMLAAYISGLVDRPVLDRTGLSGFFDFQLNHEHGPTALERSDPWNLKPVRDLSPIFAVLQEQLGLTLVPQNGPVEVFVIDHVEQPSENEPALAQSASASSAVPPQARPAAVQPSSLPPPAVRPSFASGSIKVVGPEPNRGSGIRPLGPGPFKATNASLRGLLGNAYHLTRAQSRLVSGAPDWIDSVRFNIEATAEGDPGAEQERLMEQSLLADHFKLAVHHETQVMPVYSLELVDPGKTGPRLLSHSAEAKCIVRSLTTQGPPPAGTAFCGGTYTVITETIARRSGNKMTMEQLAALLSGDVDRPVLDRTGLIGEFDYELFVDFSARQPLAPFGHADPSPNHDIALKDLSLLLEVVREQLGLKLVPQNGPVDVLVIDHVEEPAEGSFVGQQPTQN